MGISGLLPLLKSIQTNTHIRHYAGKIVGVDGYVWLHRGAFACAWDLALGNPTTK
jgi:exonuclease 1